jgi:hypothetical protein
VIVHKIITFIYIVLCLLARHISNKELNLIELVVVVVVVVVAAAVVVIGLWAIKFARK